MSLLVPLILSLYSFILLISQKYHFIQLIVNSIFIITIYGLSHLPCSHHDNFICSHYYHSNSSFRNAVKLSGSNNNQAPSNFRLFVEKKSHDGSLQISKNVITLLSPASLLGLTNAIRKKNMRTIESENFIFHFPRKDWE